MIRIPRRHGRRWIWSYLALGSIAWSGLHASMPAAAAAAPDQAAAPPIATGERTSPGARVPGADEPAFVRGGWSFYATGAADFTYTDNVYLTDTNRLSDFIISPSAGLTARRTTARSILNADFDVTYDYYTKNTRLNGARPSALLDGFANVIEDTLTVDARLATDVQQISSEERVPAIRRNLDSNQTQILNYGVTPTLHRRFGGGIDGEASYDFSAINFLDPPAGAANIRAGDTTRHIGRVQIGTEDSTAARLLWSASGYYEKSHVDNFIGTQPQRAGGEARTEYRLSGPWSLLARGGYDWIEEPTLAVQPDGAYGLVGAIWRPSRRTLVRAEAGYRYRDFNGEAQVQYQLSQTLVVSASYRRDVQSDQRLLLDRLGNLGRDEFGDLIDPITGLPPDPNAIRFDLTNQAFKRDQVRVSMYGRFQRNFYSLNGDYERRDADGRGGESWGANGTLGRDITPRLQGSLSAGYSKTTADPGLSISLRDSRTTSVGARLDYEVTRTVRTSLRYAHMQRTTTLVRYRENALILSLSKAF
ncbi:MAG: TIGR03016 family PEP-CTERM system-associated outer membrane protein [Rhodospirillaceae bacterium]|nr:TIGR03016 family PEP-CTERM system-associated outer membrane protein [Rhodospirillaceae bacterium]